ncbi:hypothetical protein J6590_026056 [Homalodisca vitripennis]|nr:hypothetical protein J6590_026056 [Homalodisca vitripennis]
MLIILGQYLLVLCVSITYCEVASTPSPEVMRRIEELCRDIRAADQAVYLALEMKHKPSMDKNLLRKNLDDYNEALHNLRKMAVENKDQVMRSAKDIFEEGLPKYFRLSFAEYKLQDNLDMNSDEIEDIYVYRGRAMDIWSDIHVELGIPWQ